MFKLVKYEIRKNIMGLIIMFAVVMGLEAYFLVSALLDNEDHVMASTVLLVFATVIAYFGILVFGVASYSKELKSKTGYMTFMTPISSFSIIGSKLFSTFTAGMFFIALFIVLAVADMAVFEEVFPQVKLFSEMLDAFMEANGKDLAEVGLEVLVEFLGILLESFVIIAMAYLSITLTATILQNKKWKGIVSVALFILLAWLIIKAGGLLPEINPVAANVWEAIVNLIPYMLYCLVLSVAAIIGCGILLEKKVSL